MNETSARKLFVLQKYVNEFTCKFVDYRARLEFLFSRLFYNSVDVEFTLDIFFNIEMQLSSVQWNK